MKTIIYFTYNMVYICWIKLCMNQQLPIHQVADIFSGYTFRTLPPENNAGHIIIAQPRDIDQRTLQLLTENALRADEFSGGAKFMIRSGDILIGSKGKTTPIILIGEIVDKIVASSTFIVVRAFSNMISPDYLAWYLQLPVVQSFLNSSKSGSTVLNLPIKAVQDCSVDLPSLPTQRAIGKLYASLLQKNKKQLELMEKYTLLINSGLYEQIRQKSKEGG